MTTDVIEIRESVVRNSSICKRKAFLQKVGLKQDTLYSKQMIAIYEMLQRTQYDGNYNYDFTNFLTEQLEGEYFSDKERDLSIELLNKQFVRYANYETAKDRIILRRQSNVDVFISDYKIKVPYNYLIEEQNGDIEIVKFKKSKPKLSPRARIFENKPRNDIGLYLLFLAAKSLFPDRSITASYYHLKNKNDKLDDFKEVFNYKDHTNIISQRFSESEEEALQERIVNLLNDGFSLTDEPEKSKECRNCFYNDLCERLKRNKNTIEIEEITPRETNENTRITPTDKQMEVIDFDEGIARVNAAAGTGKTTTLMLRVLKLWIKGTNLEDILLITFTNKAAEEMREKLLELIPDKEKVSKITIETFNSFGMKVIKSSYSSLGYTRLPRVANKIDKYDILFGISDMIDYSGFLNMKNPLLDFPNAKGGIVALDRYFEDIKIKGEESLREYDLEENEIELLLQGYALYNRGLKANNLIEYHDQITLAKTVLLENFTSDFKYKHIMVDEYQDTDPSQVVLVKALIEHTDDLDSLMVVGDDAQAIYKFRLADQNNILNFHEEFNNTYDFDITENFRSTEQILKIANLLNENNENRTEKELVSANNFQGEEVKLIKTDTQKRQYEYIASSIQNKIASGKNYKDICVIARTGQELKDIKEYFESLGFPCQYSVSIRTHEYQPYSDLMEFAELIKDGENTLSFFKFLVGAYDNESLEKLKEMTPQELKLYILAEKENVQIPEDEDLKLPFFYHVSKLFNDEILDEIVKELKEMKFESIGELTTYFKKLKEYNDDRRIDKEPNPNLNAITLITGHSSKGKEYPDVYILLDKFGIRQKTDEDKEEERRLLFVSITRAKENLEIVYHDERKKKSCFIDELEIVEEYIG